MGQETKPLTIKGDAHNFVNCLTQWAIAQTLAGNNMHMDTVLNMKNKIKIK
jgi:hypothetical protein